MRIVAAVFPSSALQLLGNCQRSRALVESRPFQANGFGLTGTEGEGENESHAISSR